MRSPRADDRRRAASHSPRHRPRPEKPLRSRSRTREGQRSLGGRLDPHAGEHGDARAVGKRPSGPGHGIREHVAVDGELHLSSTFRWAGSERASERRGSGVAERTCGHLLAGSHPNARRRLQGCRWGSGPNEFAWRSERAARSGVGVPKSIESQEVSRRRRGCGTWGQEASWLVGERAALWTRPGEPSGTGRGRSWIVVNHTAWIPRPAGGLSTGGCVLSTPVPRVLHTWGQSSTST